MSPPQYPNVQSKQRMTPSYLAQAPKFWIPLKIGTKISYQIPRPKKNFFGPQNPTYLPDKTNTIPTRNKSRNQLYTRMCERIDNYSTYYRYTTTIKSRQHHLALVN